MQTYEKAFLLDVLSHMWTVRKFEEAAADAFLKGEVRGNVHVCIGQESAVVGANLALEPTDFITASHRGHGHCVMKSGDVKHAMAELYGREAGFCKGRGGSMHVTKVESGLLGANGIVGGGIPLATGSALTSKINHDGAVTVAFFGDGATNQGCFHECLNMAAAWKLPIIYFIENNGWAVSTRIENVTNTPDLAVRAKAYNIAGETVDGTDVLAVYDVVESAARRARAGEGPTLIDCRMARWAGHFIGDPAAYMPPEYLEATHANDCILKFRDRLLAEGILTEEEANRIEEAAAETILEARKYAQSAPYPDKSGVLKYNYAMDNERSVAR